MTLLQKNKERWDKCKVHAARGPAFQKIAERILANKKIYQEIEKETSVPWWFVGMVHYRESNLDMSTNIANGQKFNRKTTIVPKGRGPFKTFKEAAYDALVNCAPHAASNRDWSAAGALTKFEEYNGLGYANKGIPSPYVWSGTDQYVRGKYVRDHVFDPNVVDVQMGGAGILKFLGIFKKATGGATAAVAVGGGTLIATYWNAFTDHWILYTLGAVSLALVIDLIVYKIRNRKTTNV